jgi:CheY-like chemotaxis protein
MMTSDSPGSDHPSYVLIVDDEEEARESLRDVVELVGCSALLAGSAQEALALLAKRRPCLMVVDLMMPGMTGAQLLEAMSREPALRTVPVVISTSAPERAPRGVPLLAKPIDIDALCGMMRRLCPCAAPVG